MRLQYINQVSIGLDVLQLAGRQQTLNDADPLCSNFRKCCGAGYVAVMVNIFPTKGLQ